MPKLKNVGACTHTNRVALKYCAMVLTSDLNAALHAVRVFAQQK